MNLARLYSQLIGICEDRNGKPRSIHRYGAGYEIHHIIARSMGGSNSSMNLVYMTPREHFTAHHILARLYGGGMWVAFFRMCQPNQGKTNRAYRITGRQYQTAREQFREAARLRNMGKVVSAETRAKMSVAKTGRKHSEKSKALMSKNRKGIACTEETKEHLRKLNAGIKWQSVTCPHCGKSGGINVMHLWHFDNCKMNPEKPENAENHKQYKAVSCPHCGKTGKHGIMHRWHFDNCKHKPA